MEARVLWARAVSRLSRRWLLFIGASIFTAALPARAAEGNKPGVEACASASEAAQNLLEAHKLLAAREKLLVCTQASCPAAIKRDCDDLLSKADAAVPSLVFSVRDDRGRDVTDARVLLDGAPLANALEGRALPVDPGSHTLRVERAGTSPLEMAIVAHEGERDRAILVQLGAAAQATPLRPPESRETEPPGAPSLAPPWTAWALGGLGVIALGTFVALAASGQSQYDHQCNGTGCPPSESAALERERAVGFVALGVGVVASAASVWLFVRSGTGGRRDASARLGLGVAGTGASLLLGGSF
jgi:hypothetical protein